MESIGSTTSFIFKRCSKVEIEQLNKGMMKYDKPLGHILREALVFKIVFNEKLSPQGVRMNKNFLLPTIVLKYLVLLALKARFMS